MGTILYTSSDTMITKDTLHSCFSQCCNSLSCLEHNMRFSYDKQFVYGRYLLFCTSLYLRRVWHLLMAVPIQYTVVMIFVGAISLYE